MTAVWEGNLLERLEALGSLAIGFSGGVDSGLFGDLATEALKDRALIVTAVSASLPAADCGWNYL